MSELVTPPPLDPALPSSRAAAGWYPDSNSGRTRWWDGGRWTEQFAPTAAEPVQVVVVDRGVNHILHLLLSVITVGLWIPVWIIIAILHQTRRPPGSAPMDRDQMLIRAGIAIGVIVIILIAVSVGAGR